MASTLLSPEQETLTQDARDQRLARSLWFLGGLMTVHADSADTNGAFALIETSGPAGGEPPLHVHRNEDELFYVLEGELKVTRGSEQITLRAGESGFLPRRIPHTFKIASGTAHWLVYITPGGFEGYFRAIGEPARELAPPKNPAPPDFEKMSRLAAEFGVSFLARK